MVAWQWGGGGGQHPKGKYLNTNFTGELGLIVLGLKSFIFLFYGFGIWPLKFSQNQQCFGQQQPPRHFGTYLRIYFYRVQFRKVLNFGCH